MADPAPSEFINTDPLDNSLGYLLRLAQLQCFSDYFDAMGPEAPPPGEFSALLLIRANPGIRQGALARSLRIKRAHMTKMVKRLEAEGILSRAVPPKDKRSVTLRLTEMGQQKLTALEPAFLAHDTARPQTLLHEETARLRELLRLYLGMSDS